VLYAYDQSSSASLAVKEVQNHIPALRVGYQDVRDSGLIRLRTILRVQEGVEQNNAGLRKLLGTVLKNQTTGATLHEPLQNAVVIEKLMADLVDFIHVNDELDPILRMAIAHHQFESIHPFYDGNGRTGRILNLLILQREGLLDLPVLYLSRYISSIKSQYYQLLQLTRETNNWVDWCVYIVKGIAVTAKSEIKLIKNLRKLMQTTKHRLRAELPKIYSQDLLNNLFRYPYTKIEFVEKDSGVSRITAAKHLDTFAKNGFVEKKNLAAKISTTNRSLFLIALCRTVGLFDNTHGCCYPLQHESPRTIQSPRTSHGAGVCRTGALGSARASFRQCTSLQIPAGIRGRGRMFIALRQRGGQGRPQICARQGSEIPLCYCR